MKTITIVSLILSLLVSFLVAENAHEPEEIKAKVAYVKIPQLEDLENNPVISVKL